MKNVEYHLEFLSKTEAEDALDFFENRPGYLGCLGLVPDDETPHWRLRVLFAADRVESLSSSAVLSRVGAVSARPVEAAAG